MDGNDIEHIRERAYRIWEAEGRPEGKEREHWERAEAEIASAPSSEQDDAAITKPKAARKPTARKAKKTPA